MSNFYFYGSVIINGGVCGNCECLSINPANCGSYIHTMALDFENNLLTFNIVGTIGTNVNMTLSPENGSPLTTACAPIGETYSISIDDFGSILGGNGTIALNAYSDECSTLLCSESFPFYTNQIEVPLEGNAVIYNPTIDTCNDTIAYVELLNGIGNGVSMNTSNGIVTVDAQAIESNMPIYIYYATCNGIISNLIFLFLGNPQGPQQMYSCSGNTCVEDVNGQYDHPSCYGNCNGGGQQTMYSCIEGYCIEDNNGQYNNNTCNNNCIQPMYSCSGDTCILDDNGIYTTSNCDGLCETPQFLAKITLSDINNTPVPGNSVNDWNTYINNSYPGTTDSINITTVNVVNNIIEFIGRRSISTMFSLQYCPDLQSLDLSGLPNLTTLLLTPYNNNITSIDLSLHPNLKTFSSLGLGLTTIDFSSTLLIEEITLSEPDITTLDLTGLNNVYRLILNSISITTIDLSDLTNLRTLSISYVTTLTNIDTSFNTQLQQYELVLNNNITTIDISNNTAIYQLKLEQLSITSLIYSLLPNLNWLSFAANALLPNFDVSSYTNLTYLDLRGCLLFNNINLTNLIALEYLHFGNNDITTINVSNNIALKEIYYYSGNLTTLNLSNNILLSHIYIQDTNNFTTLDITSNINLSNLYISNSALTTIDISNNTLLQNLQIIYCSLFTDLDISNNPLLNVIYTEGSALNTSSVNGILSDLVSFNLNGGHFLPIYGTNAYPTGQGHIDKDTLISRGWYILTNSSPGFHLVFDNAINFPVANALDVNDWNTFFDLPNNGNSFYSVQIYGNSVKLMEGSNIHIKDSLFEGNTSIIAIEDLENSVTSLGNKAFKNATALTLSSFPAVTSAGYECFYQAFNNIFDLPSLVTAGHSCFYSNLNGNNTINFPYLTTIGYECFKNCSFLNVYLPSCTDLGGDVFDNGVFSNTAGNIITLTCPIALSTCNGGNPDGDIQFLLANHTVTVNYL